MKSVKALVSVAALTLSGLSTLIVSSPAHAAAVPVCQAVTTNVSNRHDHGLGGGDGNWAILTFTRQVTICVVSESVPQPALWQYTATVVDSGTFVTIAGPDLSPGGNDLPLVGGVPGTFTGGFKNDFLAPPIFANLIASPAPVSGDTPTTGAWIPELYSPKDGVAYIGGVYDWQWTYTTCARETWVDNETTETPPPSLTNDITGKACPTPVPASSPALPATGMSVTGSNLTGTAIAGGAAVLVGSLLVIFAARRRVRPRN